MTSTILPVELGERSYDIHIGSALLAQSGALIRPLLRRNQVVIVTDETVAGLHLETLTRSLDNAQIQYHTIVLPPGEGTKSFDHLSGLLDQMFAFGIERRTTLIALGGGVIGDLVGFAASIALRGIDFIQIPTTLLAQVDSSVGGKTAINVPAGKNLVGAFYQPKLVLADTDVLSTLPPRELRAGYAEVVKYGVIDDFVFFEWLEGHGAALLDGDMDARRHAVQTSCAAKARIVAEDEREMGKRALLNLGHTFGHALESAAGYGDRLLHGEAVSIGMVMALDLSAKLGLTSDNGGGHTIGQDAARLSRHLAELGMPTRPQSIPGIAWDANDLIARMATDKKVKDGKLTFILANGIGHAFETQDVPLEALTELIEETLTK